MLKRILIIFVLCYCSSFAQSNSGFVLLKMDVDARAAAMGGAFSAEANDASATYWNPAGLSLAKENTINLMHNNWLWDISHSFAALQFAHGVNNWALSVNYLQIPGIQIRGNTPSAEPSGESEAFNLALALSYAKEYSTDWHIGLSVKYLFEKYFLASAPGWAMDVGVIKKDLMENLDWAVTAQNIGKMSSLKNQETPLPLLLRTGIAFKIPEILSERMLLTSDLLWIKDEQTYFKAGMDYQLNTYFALRLGLKSGNKDMLWTTGLGIQYGTFHLDYAYAPFEYNLGSANRISIGLTF